MNIENGFWADLPQELTDSLAQMEQKTKDDLELVFSAPEDGFFVLFPEGMLPVSKEITKKEMEKTMSRLSFRGL